MTSTTRNEARIANNLRQIATLRSEKTRIQDSWLDRGAAKTGEMVEAIGEQICELYAEIDAIEDGESKIESTYTRHEDEVSIEELLAVRHLGWTAKDILKARKKARR